MGLHQTKRLYTAKKTINKTKRRPTKLGEIFANDISDKGLISKIHKGVIQFNIKKANNPSKN